MGARHCRDGRRGCGGGHGGGGSGTGHPAKVLRGVGGVVGRGGEVGDPEQGKRREPDLLPECRVRSAWVQVTTHDSSKAGEAAGGPHPCNEDAVEGLSGDLHGGERAGHFARGV